MLAGELARAGGDVAKAAQACRARLAGFIDAKQRAAVGMGAWFAPRTGLGLFVRNQLTRAAGLPPVARLMARRMFADTLELPDYG